MSIEIPDLCLVVLVGISGAGKSSFARKHFRATEVISSDTCRGLVSDDENMLDATGDAFDLLHHLVGIRLRRGKLTVVDATSVQPEARKSLVQLAKAHDCLAIAVVLDVPVKLAAERNADRPDRDFGSGVLRRQHSQLTRNLRGMRREGFSRVHVLDVDAIADASFVRKPLWNDRRGEHGPFDIIGDVHGCHDELRALLDRLGYVVGGTREAPRITAPEGRRAIFLGDLVDRGPDAPGVLMLAMAMVEQGAALCIPGNHEVKLLRKLNGADVKLTHGLAATVEQLAKEPPELSKKVAGFIDDLVSHFVLDDGKLVVAHAGLREQLQGRASGRVRSFCLYGDTTGETDEFGLPVRYDWAQDYRGRAMVVYGHTPVPEAEWVNRTICIDTGCCFGGKLTALRYPERELVQVPAARVYYEPVRPLVPKVDRPHDVIDFRDVAGKRIVETRTMRNITIPAERGAAALEVMSRFAIDPRWLVYLPPTMAPSATAPAGSPWLERPHEAFTEFASSGVERIVCEEKHMGSRAVVIVARSVDAAQRRFGVDDGKRGVVYTRTGRPFFGDDADEAALVDRVADAIAAAGLWEGLETDWVCLDAELMPWSLKARELVRSQYAGVGAAGSRSLAAALDVLERSAARGGGSDDLAARFRDRNASLAGYRDAWRRYCWEVATLDDLKLAPFHLLASEGRTFFDRTHVWHMETLAQLARHDAILVATPFRVVTLDDEAECAAAIAWWEELTGKGGEGMVVKPEHYVVRGARGLAQPAVKCRGREYLRIIYGPEYTAPAQLERLRSRGLGRKRSLALRELALGMEALQRFVESEPLWRVHECVFGVLALESEPVDPRL